MPDNTVYIGRPSMWGNPYKQEPYMGKDWRAVVTAKYRSYLLDPDNAQLLKRAQQELKGKDLACWCPEGAPCHGDVLIELANKEPEHE